MNEEQAFLAAIVAAPHDDTPRLMYADWLEEHADKIPGGADRAAFLRVQIELHRRYPGGDPGLATNFEGAMTAELLRREAELREQMIDALGPEIAVLVRPDPALVTFDRGLIKHLYLPYTRITRLPEGLWVGGDLDLAYSRVTSLPAGLQVGGVLYLTGTPITALPDGLRVAGGIYLGDSQITSLPVGLRVGGDLDVWGSAITSLPEDLQVGGYLDLTDTPITAAAARRIAGMPGLSTAAKVTGLRSLGMDALAEQVEREARTRKEGRGPNG